MCKCGGGAFGLITNIGSFRSRKNTHFVFQSTKLAESSFMDSESQNLSNIFPFLDICAA